MINTTTLAKSYIVYRIICEKHTGKQTLFIGMCPTSELSTIPDAYTWEAFNIDDAPIELTIIGIYEDRSIAEIFQTGIALSENAIINIQMPTRRHVPPHKGKPGAAIIEVTYADCTGRWKNAAALAKQIKKTPASVSQHLNGKLPTLDGRVFKREQ